MHNTIFINHIVNPRQTTLIMMPAAVLAATIKYCGWLVLPLSSIPTWCASCWNKKLNNFRWANFLFDSYIPSMCHSQHQKQHLVPNLISIKSPLKRSKWTKNSWHFVDLHNEHLQKKNYLYQMLIEQCFEIGNLHKFVLTCQQCYWTDKP